MVAFSLSFKRSVLIAALALSITGCGAAQASRPAPPASSSATATHTKKTHKSKGIHVKGAVTSISASKLIVKTKTGTVFTFTLSSHTKYREKKKPINSAQIKTGETVAVAARHRKSSLVARVVRLL
ncbi:MAG: DUF5666 domain-containing protein [Firmicutes bacterium]|jgi:hypothetical protein|uniref:Uncharacterized protein n=1 Tax=Sulfobacillus benefaciens TaxID=453960 RepID=A0A2T2X9G4_9FIRM|nr:DUF5666 domain-containing protein [Bacillota bacterium]MCL5013161.1 DUF5666 domain-containing protein [Bacillota bacterium]PSR31154.1 MAG: hypothetical protein C7B43_03390 [Sulfobacillus benefaciens]HBQ94393.1 hypothetical protein [Sulfobacillus sp.]